MIRPGLFKYKHPNFEMKNTTLTRSLNKMLLVNGCSKGGFGGVLSLTK